MESAFAELVDIAIVELESPVVSLSFLAELSSSHSLYMASFSSCIFSIVLRCFTRSLFRCQHRIAKMTAATEGPPALTASRMASNPI